MTRPDCALSAGLLGARADDGAHVVGVELVPARFGTTLDLTIDSPAVGSLTRARLLLPRTRDQERTYPALYLLHGAAIRPGPKRTWRAWTTFSDVARQAASYDALVVMPDGLGAGYYSDHRPGGRKPAPQLETYLVTELPQLLQRAGAASTTQAIAGLSMGGFGAFSLAARHPGRYTFAASYSCPLNTLRIPLAIRSLVAVNGLDPDGLWGHPRRGRSTWQQHNPADLADRLARMPTYISYGTSPLDPIETAARQGSKDVAARIRRAGGTPTVEAFPGQRHTWACWQRGLTCSLPLIMASMGAGSRDRAV